MSQRLLMGTALPLNDDQIAIVAISAGVKRDGDEWIPGGVDLTNFNRNPVVLLQHDPNKPIGVAALALSGSQIEGIVQFAPAGISADADQARGLAKSGILSGISAGIDPLEVEPIDPRNSRGGMRVLRAELLEISLVTIPVDPDARVTARSYASRSSRAALLRRLPSIPVGAIDRLRVALTQTPIERRLAAVAAEVGGTLTSARMAQIIAEARQLGRTPEYHLRWTYLASGVYV
jgi:HK97 family phage prohead protease